MGRACSLAIGFAVIFVWSASALAEEKSIGIPLKTKGHSGGVLAVDISSDGRLAASCDKSTVRIWRTGDGSAIRELKPIEVDAPDRFMTDIAFSPDGKSLAVAASHQPVTFWETSSWKRLDKSLSVEQTVNHLAYSPEGSKLATAENASVRVWDLKRQAVLHTFKFDGIQIGAASRVAYSPKGLVVAAALQDYGASFEPKSPKVQAWNAVTGSIVFTGWTHASAAAVAISSQDSLLAAASGPTVEVWSLYAHQSLFRFSADENAVFCLAFSPDGRALATGGNDSLIKLWNMDSGKLTGTLEGHYGQVHDLCFSKDGQRLISGAADKAVLIWDLATNVTRK